MTNKTETFWDKLSKNYDKVEYQQFKPITKQIISHTKKYLNTEDYVLDFGCATGNKTLELANYVNHIHGMDISQKMISEALIKMYMSHITNCSFKQGTIFNNHFQPSSFDKITSFAVLHLLEDKELVIKKIHELLKPGGLFIASAICTKERMTTKQRLSFLFFNFLKTLGLLPLHFNHFTMNDMEILMNNQGFQTIEKETLFHDITISYIVVKKPSI